MKNNLKNRVFGITVLFSLLLVVATVILFLLSKTETSENLRSK